MNKVLYVTSFAEDMYLASGCQLIQSFLDYQVGTQKGDLLICYENFDFKLPTNNQILTYPLHTSKFLNDWLELNKDIIPDYLGGQATVDNNPEIFQNGSNRKCSRWFRKIASLHVALELYSSQYDTIVWLDSDCHFITTLTIPDLRKIFRDYDVIYHWGDYRRKKKLGVESGIIGFRTGSGYQFLETVCQVYISKKFKEYEFWSDGCIFGYLIDELASKFSGLDLVVQSALVEREVIECGPFQKYLIHDKGKHRLSKILV